MKKTLLAVLLVAPFALPPALAQQEQGNSQAQHRCAEAAGGKTVDVRPEFMENCTHGRSSHIESTGSQAAVQAKLKTCKAEAKSKNKADRDQYVRACMKRQK